MRPTPAFAQRSGHRSRRRTSSSVTKGVVASVSAAAGPVVRRRRRLPMPVTIGFNHVATLTTDLDRLVQFYVKAFDAELTFEMEAREDHPRMAILDLGGGAALNVFEAADGAIIGEQRRQGARGAIDHFGLAVGSRAELEAVEQRLREAGADLGQIQQLGDTWSLFFRDVDGMELEVCAPAGE